MSGGLLGGSQTTIIPKLTIRHVLLPSVVDVVFPERGYFPRRAFLREIQTRPLNQALAQSKPWLALSTEISWEVHTAVWTEIVNFEASFCKVFYWRHRCLRWTATKGSFMSITSKGWASVRWVWAEFPLVAAPLTSLRQLNGEPSSREAVCVGRRSA